MTPDKKKLLRLFDDLEDSDRATLLDFAEFLQSRIRAPNDIPKIPKDIPRPPTESVIGAIKRLTATYPMIEQALLLNDTSVLMSAHLMEGRPAKAVIDDLEGLFSRHYEAWLHDQSGQVGGR